MAAQVTARPLLVYVLAFALVMTVPPLGLAVWTTARWVSAERDRLLTETQQKTDQAVTQLDRFLAGKVAMLQALATSPAMDHGDFRQIDLQARELLDLQGVNIVLRDLHGQQLVNTRLPWGTALPRVPINEPDRIVAATGRPYISDLYLGLVSGAQLIRAIVPVSRAGAIRYTLTANLSPLTLSALLREAGIAEPYPASIADRTGQILASDTSDPGRIGMPLPGFHKATEPFGSWEGRNQGGTSVRATYRWSSVSGWLFSVGVDQDVLDAPLYRSLWWLGVVALLLGITTFGISSLLARRVLQSHRQIADAAAALGHGLIVSEPKTRLEETNLIARALSEASRRLREQADALVAANRDLEQRVVERTREVSDQATLIRATLDNMDQGLMLIEAQGTVPICNQRALDLLDLPAAFMAARPSFEQVLDYQMSRGEFAGSRPAFQLWVEQGGLAPEAHVYERQRPNGIVLEIRTVPIANGGAVRTYTDITARKTAELRSHHMARHDALTGLPNRTLFRERLTEELLAATEQGRSLAVLCLDLDRFKAVNDTLGHPVGDLLLQGVAERISEAVGSADIVARLGGDEFSIVQMEPRQPEAALDLAARLIDALRIPFEIDGHPIAIGASVGVAIGPRDGQDADHIFKNADIALYGAKADGRNTYRLHEPAMDLAIRNRRALEMDLRGALERHEFVLHYQPVTDVVSGSISGFEALIRWRHPVRGLVPPGEFISLAEDLKLIVPIGTWVLREACREAASWPLPVKILVNVSTIQVDDIGLFGCVVSALGGSGLAPSRLQLEITESVLMHRSDDVMSRLRAIRDLGVRIALDDFGTGYSSLSYLQHFALDAIKIDRSFVQGSENRTNIEIFKAIVGLARGLGMSVTAEGVETDEQLRRVREAGCQEVQGFLLGRPVPAEQARHDLAASCVETVAA